MWSEGRERRAREAACGWGHAPNTYSVLFVLRQDIIKQQPSKMFNMIPATTTFCYNNGSRA